MRHIIAAVLAMFTAGLVVYIWQHGAPGMVIVAVGLTSFLLAMQATEK